MKYINKQKHDKTCGAVAFVNVHRKLGKRMSYDNAIRICGGLKSFKKGMTMYKLKQLLKKRGFKVVTVNYNESLAKFFSSTKGFAVVVSFRFKVTKGIGSHAVALDKNGYALNNSGCKVILQRDIDYTKKVYKSPPLMMIIEG